MSSEPVSHGADALPPHAQEEENLPTRRIVMIGVWSVLLFLVSVLITAWVLHRDTVALSGMGVFELNRQRAAGVGQAELGLVDMGLFETENRAPQLLERHRARLEGYGWVDRENELVHIPIEEAMRQLAQGQQRR